MPWNFHTKLARKLRRMGYAKKPAYRLAVFSHLLMLAACGLLGIFFIPDKELSEPMPGAGMKREGSRPGTFTPAAFAIRR